MLPQTFRVTARRDNFSTDHLGQSATLIILRVIVPVHNSSQHFLKSGFIYSPLSLFLTQQSVLSPTFRETFARDIRKEFFEVFETIVPVALESQEPVRISRWQRFTRKFNRKRPPNDLTSSGRFPEEAAHGMGNEVTIEAGREQVRLSRLFPQTSDTENQQMQGVVVQQSVIVTVTDKEGAHTRASVISDSSGTDMERSTRMNVSDNSVWTDISFKGIATR
jgi:hypothetical protein